MNIKEKAKVCFVIMPFGEKSDVNGQIIPFDDVFDYIIKPVVEEKLKFKCVRCDKLENPGWIHRDMIEHIIKDDVVIVDITTLNPNVFYELGVRHAFKKYVTILMRKEGTQVPFNIRGSRIIEYDLGIAKAEKAKQNLENFIHNGLKNGKNDSIVYDVFPDLKALVD